MVLHIVLHLMQKKVLFAYLHICGTVTIVSGCDAADIALSVTECNMC